MNVGARAVGGTVPGPSCIYVLDPTGDDALWIKGSASIVTPNCGIQVDSNSANAGFASRGLQKSMALTLRHHGKQSSGGKCGKNAGTNIRAVPDQ